MTTSAMRLHIPEGLALREVPRGTVRATRTKTHNSLPIRAARSVQPLSGGPAVLQRFRIPASASLRLPRNAVACAVAARDVRCRAVAAEAAATGEVQRHTLQGGTQLTVWNDPASLTVHVRASPPAGVASEWQMPKLVLHWGVTEGASKDWKLPSSQYQPPGTKNYKKRALQTPMIADNPGGAHGGDCCISVTLEKSTQRLAFVLIDTNTKFWHKNAKGDFVMSASGAPGAPSRPTNNVVQMTSGPRATVEPPAELLQVWAYLRWEEKGKPDMSPSESEAAFDVAAAEVKAHLDNGTPLAELMASCGLDPGPAAPAPPPPSPPSPAAPAAVRDQEVPESLVGLAAYLLWEEAGNPDGADFGVQAKALLQEALRSGVALGEVEGRMRDASRGPTAAARLGLKDVPANFSPPAAKSAAASNSKQSSKSHQNLAQRLASVEMQNHDHEMLTSRQGGISKHGGVSEGMVNRIVDAEPGCTRSFMHRYNAASDMLEEAARSGGDDESDVAAVFVWLRFCALRQLVWNRNYNIKPREIASAQERLTGLFQNLYQQRPERRDLVRLLMSVVGRGGEGNGGQRIRDEILDIQSANDCKGGFMEEWHQKLHNNTTPDDVQICQALLNYIDSGLDISQYWRTLHENGIDKDRLMSFDRKIHSEPSFRQDQCDGLRRDLTKYLTTLKAVHSGADLSSAAGYVFGYKQDQCKGKDVQVSAVGEVATDRLRELVDVALLAIENNRLASLQGGEAADPLLMLRAVVNARFELRQHLKDPGHTYNGRLKDVLYLDLALEQTARTVMEGSVSALERTGVSNLMQGSALALESLCMSTHSNEELVLCLKEWQQAMETQKRGDDGWALRAKAVMDRIRTALLNTGEAYNARFQGAAEAMGPRLNVDPHVTAVFSEEVIRGGGAAPLSILLNKLDPMLRQAADLGAWQVISPVTCSGYVEVVDNLAVVQMHTYDRPTILVSRRVSGEEEIPEGCVAVLTPDMPDVLSHVSVRARNEKVLFASCFDAPTFEGLCGMQNAMVKLEPAGEELRVETLDTLPGAGEAADAGAASASPEGAAYPLGVGIAKREFCGKFALGCDEMSNDVVGGKSQNLAQLRGNIPEDVKLPEQVALPFGTLDAVLADPINAAVAAEMAALLADNMAPEKLQQTRELVKRLQAPEALKQELAAKMRAVGLPFPGDEGEARWNQAWAAITGVWASKWNDRAFLACKKAGLQHENLSMAVLCQQVVPAAYAFVIHTTNPLNGNKDEIYCEVVRGLGEVLVGNYPGRALSFVANKNELWSPKVVGFPSKSVGLFVQDTLIFRSDSNGEDLEGFAGAGLYDSITMDKCEELRIEYAEDPMVNDVRYQKLMLSRIATAGYNIEHLLGTPQDLEGCITSDGDLYIVQTRPQV